MQIQKIDALGKYRHAVYFTLDDGEELTMPLYGSELRRYHIKEGEELPDSVYRELCTQVLNRRAVERSEYLLARKNYTAAELTRKLQQGFYPETVIAHVLSFMTEYGFIDDARFAQRYIEFHGRRKSARQLRMELACKGVDRQIIDQAFENAGGQEQDALVRLVEKRCRNVDLSEPKEWNRQLRYFAGKGFAFDAVKQELTRFRNQKE